MRKTDNSTHQTIMYFRLLCSKRRIQFPPISPSVITMSKSERFENMQGRILPNFDESTSRILVDDELIAAFLYINSYGSMHERFPCLIVSLGLLLIYEILAQKIGLGVSKTIPADVGMIGKFPYSLIILGASALLFYYIYNKTCIACHIRAVGNEELLANALGVNAMNTKYMTFVLAGIFIGITAILQISYANSITTVSSLRSISMIFQPLMGVLIAFAIQEWCNLTLGVFISQFTLSMMFNALIALGVPSKMQDVVLGVMLIIVMGIALNNKRISGFFERKARRKELMKRA